MYQRTGRVTAVGTLSECLAGGRPLCPFAVSFWPLALGFWLLLLRPYTGLHVSCCLCDGYEFQKLFLVWN